jgi:hypothetical protein
MITFGKHFSVGMPTTEVKNYTGIYEDGKEVGAIYFAPMSFNQGFEYGIVLKKKHLGFFQSLDTAKRHILTGFPVAVKYF